MRRYEILLFDADNALFDFTRAEELAFRVTAEAGGLDYSDALYRRYSEINDSLWKKLERRETDLESLKLERFRLLLEECAPDTDDFPKRAAFLRDTYIEALGDQSCLVDGAEELCRALAGRYRMFIVTNGISRIQRRRFAASTIAPYFEGMFVSEEIGAQKPSPAYFDAVFAALSHPEKSSVLVIGDPLTSDCDGAIAYGLDICRFDPKGEGDGGRALTYTVRKLSEIRDLLDGGTI